MENNDTANKTSILSTKTGKLIVSSLQQNLDKPEDGLDFYALGDGNGSWISILKQLHARGVICVKPSETLSFNELIAEQEAFEVQVKRTLNTSGINDYTPEIQLNQYPADGIVFNYINNLPDFLKKFQANTVNGKQIEVVLIGDLLGDRLTNNFSMIHFLDAFKNSIDFKIIYSNHDHAAMNFFHHLLNLVNAYESKHQGAQFITEAVDQEIFKELLANINHKINSMKASDGRGKELTGVHFMYSSITWFYALRNQVHQKESITPIKDFLNMLYSAYMHKVSLALARSFGDADEQNHAIFTHATCLIESPKVSEMNKYQLRQMISSIASNDQKNGGSSVRSVLNYYKNSTFQDQLLAISQNSFENLFAFVYTRYLHYVNESIKSSEEKEDLLASASGIHTIYNKHLNAYRNRLNPSQTPRVTVNAGLGIVNSLNAMIDLFREKNWLIYILCEPQILSFTQNRVLYDHPFTQHIVSIHGHVGYISLSHYNSKKSNGVNLDSNGAFANRPHGGEHRVYAGTKFNHILLSNTLRTPVGNGVPVQETPAVEQANKARIQARIEAARNGMFDRENRPNHNQSSSPSNKRSLGEVADTVNNNDNKRPSNR